MKKRSKFWILTFLLLGMTTLTGCSSNDEESSGNGNDAMGFRALPSGIVYEGSYMYQGFHTYYWTSTERDSTTAYYRSLSYDASDIYRYYNFKTAGYSVRCVQNAK